MISKKSKKKSIMTATTITTIALIAILLTLPVTPATTTTLNTESQTTAKFIDPNKMLNDARQGRIVSDFLEMRFADMEGQLKYRANLTITPRNLGIAFIIHTARIVEFVDSNNNSVPDSNEIVNEIELSSLSWTVDGISKDENGIQIRLVGSSIIEIYIHIYFKDVNIGGPNGEFSATVPGLKAVKIDLVVKQYNWQRDDSKLALVLLLRCEQIEAQHEYRFRLTNGTIFSQYDGASGFIPRLNNDESEIGLVMATHENEVRATFRWFNYAVRNNGSSSVVDVISWFNVTDEGVALYLCVEHFGNDEISFDPYFAVLATGEGAFPTTLALQYYLVMLASSQATKNFILMGAAGALAVAGVATAFYLRRK